MAGAAGGVVSVLGSEEISWLEEAGAPATPAKGKSEEVLLEAGWVVGGLTAVVLSF